jgi:hypothetical protein
MSCLSYYPMLASDVSFASDFELVADTSDFFGIYLVLPQKFHIDELASIGVHARSQEYKPGEVLVYQGHESTELFIVSDGYVDVTISQASAASQYIRTLGRGAVMGEAALFSKEPRTANILAKSRVVAFIIHCDDLIDELSPQRLEQLKTKLGFQFTKWKLAQADLEAVDNRVRPHKMGRRGSGSSLVSSHPSAGYNGRVVQDEMLSYQKQGRNRRRETPLRRRRSLVSEVATTIYTSTLMEDLRRIYKGDEVDDAEDNYFTSDMALLMRESLKFDPGILKVLNDIWVVVDGDHSGDIDKAEYIGLMVMVARALIGAEVDLAAIRDSVEEDWIVDSGGRSALDKVRFQQCWFQLADRWTDSISAEEYCNFLQGIFRCIAVKDHNGVIGLRDFDDLLDYQDEQQRRLQEEQAQLEVPDHISGWEVPFLSPRDTAKSPPVPLADAAFDHEKEAHPEHTPSAPHRHHHHHPKETFKAPSKQKCIRPPAVQTSPRSTAARRRLLEKQAELLLDVQEVVEHPKKHGSKWNVAYYEPKEHCKISALLATSTYLDGSGEGGGLRLPKARSKFSGIKANSQRQNKDRESMSASASTTCGLSTSSSSIDYQPSLERSSHTASSHLSEESVDSPHRSARSIRVLGGGYSLDASYKMCSSLDHYGGSIFTPQRITTPHGYAHTVEQQQTQRSLSKQDLPMAEEALFNTTSRDSPSALDLRGIIPSLANYKHATVNFCDTDAGRQKISDLEKEDNPVTIDAVQKVERKSEMKTKYLDMMTTMQGQAQAQAQAQGRGQAQAQVHDGSCIDGVVCGSTIELSNREQQTQHVQSDREPTWNLEASPNIESRPYTRRGVVVGVRERKRTIVEAIGSLLKLQPSVCNSSNQDIEPGGRHVVMFDGMEESQQKPLAMQSTNNPWEKENVERIGELQDIRCTKSFGHFSAVDDSITKVQRKLPTKPKCLGMVSITLPAESFVEGAGGMCASSAEVSSREQQTSHATSPTWKFEASLSHSSGGESRHERAVFGIVRERHNPLVQAKSTLLASPQPPCHRSSNQDIEPGAGGRHGSFRRTTESQQEPAVPHELSRHEDTRDDDDLNKGSTLLLTLPVLSPSSSQKYTVPDYTRQRETARDKTAQDKIRQHNTTQHSTTPSNFQQHIAAQHNKTGDCTLESNIDGECGVNNGLLHPESALEVSVMATDLLPKLMSISGDRT